MFGAPHTIYRSIPADRSGRFTFLTVTLLTGMLIALLISQTPPGVDDLLFLLPAKGHNPSPGLWSMMIGEMPRIWETQTGRLGNFIAMPMLYLMPKWVFAAASGALTSLLIILSCRMTRSRFGSIVSWLIYASVILAYPWYDFLTMVTYGVNYIWAATAAVGAIICFLKIGSFSRAGYVAACIMMFIAGWMHEGFGVPMTAGLTLCLIFHHKESIRRRMAAWISAGAGTCMTALSPVFWSRSDGDEINLLMKYPYKELLMNIGPAILFLFALGVTTIWIASRSSDGKRILLSAENIILTTATLAATAVYLKFYTGPRTAAPALLYSMLACGYILTAATQYGNVSRWMQRWIAVLIGVFSITHLSYACYRQIGISLEYEEATRLFEESDDGVFYYDLSYPEADLTLYKTSVRQMHERVPKEFMRMYFNPDHKMVVLPTSMKGFTPDKAIKSDLTPEAMIFNGWIIVPDSFDTESFHRIHILTEDGRYLPTRFRVDRFSCPGYGNFKLLTPHIKVLDVSMKVKDAGLRDHSR